MSTIEKQIITTLRIRCAAPHGVLTAQVAVYNHEMDNAGTGEVMWTTAATGFIDYSLPQYV